jgi:hypothetical protein
MRAFSQKSGMASRPSSQEKRGRLGVVPAAKFRFA